MARYKSGFIQPTGTTTDTEYGVLSLDDTNDINVPKPGQYEVNSNTGYVQCFTVPDGVYGISGVAVGGGGSGAVWCVSTIGGGGGGLAWSRQIPTKPGCIIKMKAGSPPGSQQGSFSNGCGMGGGDGFDSCISFAEPTGYHITTDTEIGSALWLHASYSPNGNTLFSMVCEVSPYIREYGVEEPFNLRTICRCPFSPQTVVREKSGALSTGTFAGESTACGTGLYFKPDGTKLFVANHFCYTNAATTGRMGGVTEYCLEEPWNLQSIKYRTHSFATPTACVIVDLTFSENGCHMYVTEQCPGKIYQVNLREPWDLCTVNNCNLCWNCCHLQTCGTCCGIPTHLCGRGIDISANGSLLFVGGSSGQQFYVYNVCTPFDITTACFKCDITFPGSTCPLGGLRFVKDGCVMYQYMHPGCLVRYEFTAPYEFGANGTQTCTTGCCMGNGSGVWVSEDECRIFGTQLGSHLICKVERCLGTNYSYCSGTYRGEFCLLGPNFLASNGQYFFAEETCLTTPLHRYSLYSNNDITTPYNRQLGGFHNVKVCSGFNSSPAICALTYNSDGTKLVGLTCDYALFESTPVDGFSFRRDFSCKCNRAGLRGFVLSPDGKHLFTSRASDFQVLKWELETPYYLENAQPATYNYCPTALWRSTDFNFRRQNDKACFGTGISFSSNGSIMYVSRLGPASCDGPSVDKFCLSVPWRIYSATKDQSLQICNQNACPYSVDISANGHALYTGNCTGGYFQWCLSTPHDLSTATYCHCANLSTVLTLPMDLHFKPDGTCLYTVDYTCNIVYGFPLSTPWDLTSTGFNFGDNVDIVGQECLGTGISLNPDGTKMFVMGRQNDAVQVYDLSTPWDVSTATFYRTARQINSHLPTASPQGLAFSSNGALIYNADVGTGVSCGFIHEHYGMDSLLTLCADAVPQTANGGPLGAIAFSDDGSKLFAGTCVTGVATDCQILTYCLANNFVLGTAVLDVNANLSLCALNGSICNRAICNIRFGNNGCKLYISDPTIEREYDLTTPYTINNVNNVVRNDLPEQRTGVMYGPVSYMCHQNYVLTAGVDCCFTTAARVCCCAINTKDFIDQTGVHLYTSHCTGCLFKHWCLSTPWDITTACAQQFGCYEQYMTVCNLWAHSRATEYNIGNDGSSIYWYDTCCCQIRQWCLSTAYDPSSTPVEQTALCIYCDDGTTPTHSYNFKFTSNGSVLFANMGGSTENARLRKYCLSTPWQVSTAVCQCQATCADANGNCIICLASFVISDSGCYVTAFTGACQCCYQNYIMTTPFDPTTLTTVGTAKAFGQIRNSNMYSNGSVIIGNCSCNSATTTHCNTGGWWHTNGYSTMCGTAGFSNDACCAYFYNYGTSGGGNLQKVVLDSPWEMNRDFSHRVTPANTEYCNTTANLIRNKNNFYCVAGAEWSGVFGICVNGTNNSCLYVAGTDYCVTKYCFGTPGDLTTLVCLQSDNMSSTLGYPCSFTWKPDGTRAFAHANQCCITQVDLTTPWDLSTATLDYTYKKLCVQCCTLNSTITCHSSFFFSCDGKKFFEYYNDGKIICEHALSTAWDISEIGCTVELDGCVCAPTLVKTHRNFPSLTCFQGNEQPIRFIENGTKLQGLRRCLGVTGFQIATIDLDIPYDVSSFSRLCDSNPACCYYRDEAAAVYYGCAMQVVNSSAVFVAGNCRLLEFNFLDSWQDPERTFISQMCVVNDRHIYTWNDGDEVVSHYCMSEPGVLNSTQFIEPAFSPVTKPYHSCHKLENQCNISAILSFSCNDVGSKYLQTGSDIIELGPTGGLGGSEYAGSWGYNSCNIAPSFMYSSPSGNSVYVYTRQMKDGGFRGGNSFCCCTQFKEFNTCIPGVAINIVARGGYKSFMCGGVRVPLGGNYTGAGGGCGGSGGSGTACCCGFTIQGGAGAGGYCGRGGFGSYTATAAGYLCMNPEKGSGGGGGSGGNYCSCQTGKRSYPGGGVGLCGLGADGVAGSMGLCWGTAGTSGSGGELFDKFSHVFCCCWGNPLDASYCRSPKYGSGAPGFVGGCMSNCYVCCSRKGLPGGQGGVRLVWGPPGREYPLAENVVCVAGGNYANSDVGGF